jgi:diguanylate cyclase (GGDEF)-like protein/PAS domain S-box-containing protein
MSKNSPLSGKTDLFKSEIAGLVLVVIAYWFAVRLGLLLVAQPEGVASIWPVSGLALAAFLLTPKRRWLKLAVVIFLTNAVGNWTGGNSLAVSLGFALANMLESVLGAWTLEYFCKSKITFERAKESVVLLAVAVLSNGVTALLGAAVPALAFGAPFIHAWLLWWAADGLGMLLVTPVIICWVNNGQGLSRTFSAKKITEMILLVFLLVVFALLLFGPFTQAEKPFLRNYMLFPLLIWLAFRFTPLEMANLLLLFAGIAIWNTQQGYGIFSFPTQTRTEHLISLQIYLGVVSFSGSLLSAMVSERKQTGEVLRLAEAKYRAIFENAPVGIFQSIPQGNFLSVNPAMSKIFGYSSPQEMVAIVRDISRQIYVNPADQERFVNNLREHGEVSEFVACNQRKDGTHIWTQTIARTEKDAQGNIIYYEGFITDITERRQMEGVLHASEENFRNLAENLLEGILIATTDGRHVYANHRAAEVLGYLPEELLQTTQKDLADPAAYPVLQQRLRDRIAGRFVPAAYETIIRRKDGTSFPADITGTRTVWQGQACDLVFFRDITERKQAEAALRESEEKYRRLFDNTNLGIFQSTPQGRAISVNAAFARMFGYDSPEDAIQSIKNVGADVFMDPNRRAEIIRLMAENPGMRVFENLYRRKDGSSFTGRLNTIPITDSEGNLIRVEGIIEDITERKKAEEALRASEEKYRMVANFTYDWEAWQAPYGVYLYVSPSCERITGYAAEEFIADANLIISIMHPDDRANVIDHFQATVNQAREKDMAFDFRIITKSGETRWINHSCIAVYGEDGKWLGRRESNRDITARKRDEVTMRSRLWLSQFADTHTGDELLETTLNEAEALTGSQIGFFHFLDADQKALRLQMWSTNTLRNMCAAEGKGLHYPVDQAGVWVDCVHTGAPVIYNDYAGLPASRRKGLPEGHAPVTRILVVPIVYGDLIVAIFGVGNKPTNYDDMDVKSVSQLGHMVWEVILRKRAEKEVVDAKEKLEMANQDLKASLIREQKLSHTDALTGINNRRYLFELAVSAFDLAARHQYPLSVMMFDVDRFKQVNDTYGHDVGDQILQRMVQAACEELRSSDVIGRYGGEEFIVILPMTTAQQAYLVAERIRASAEAVRVPTPKGDAFATISVGIAELIRAPKPADGQTESVDDLIRRADEAMYAAKQSGRNRIVTFERE